MDSRLLCRASAAATILPRTQALHTRAFFDHDSIGGLIGEGVIEKRLIVEGPGPEVGGANDQLGYQPALDGLRAVSVLAVLAGHMFTTLGGGGHGVDVFFVLSGFLITILLLQEHAATGGSHCGPFGDAAPAGSCPP